MCHVKVLMIKLVKGKKLFVIQWNNAKTLMQKKNWGIECYSQDLKRKKRNGSDTLTRVDIESKVLRRQLVESREKFFSNLEKAVTPEGFVYYVDRSSANIRGDDCLFLSDW